MKFLSSQILLVIALGSIVQGADPQWPPAEGVPVTRWGRQIAVDKPVWPEYPRPQLVRERWLNLNGLWDYALTPCRNAAAKTSVPDMANPAEAFSKGTPTSEIPTAWDGQILVPFPIESVLSQVNRRVEETNRLWYHRTVQLPAGWAGERVLLHFGAVDWEATVWVNGKRLGVHRGGYDGFSFDITAALTPHALQELVVSVWDPTEGGQPEGKQSRKPGGIFYTPVTGIWQTAWLEPVPESYVKELRIIPEVDRGELRLTAVAEGSAESMEAVVLSNGQEIAHASGKSGEALVVSMPNARLWWPEDPFLYDLKINLKKEGKTVDVVRSYFGMRKISLGADNQGRTRMLLNNRFVFQNGFLDQGFWPDGVYTAPTDEALRYDIEMTRKLGFNLSRKHIKVESDRWYHWCDKLGLLVWQDMPSVILRRKALIPDVDGQFELELRRMIEGRINHPSIIVWVLFNEGWGLEMSRTEKEVPSDQTQAMVRRMVAAARQADPTRLINHESGAGGSAWQGKNPWDLGLGDIVDFHCYGGHGPRWEAHRAGVIGETGWGVGLPSSVERLLPEVESLALSAVVITQLTDVENEKNGALTYDRVLKGKIPAELKGAEMRAKLAKGLGPDWCGPSATHAPSPFR